jgi:HEAT repeat protein
MADATDPPIDRLVDHLERGETDAAAACLDRLATDDRKPAVRSLQRLADERPAVVAPLAPSLTAFLDDSERSVRLSTAKLFVRLADAEPAGVEPAVPALADRLADDEEFYYVRGRAAEALGYVARERPDAVVSPELVADLRIGLSFDEPEVVPKLAKALEHVALGDPARLGHHVGALAEHLDHGDEIVRYHLSTALVVVGCERPDRLDDARAALLDQLDDESPYVRGRVAEALGLLARGDDPVPADSIPDADDGDPPFLVDRLRFARTAIEATGGETPGRLGTVAGVRATTETAVAAITAPDADRDCPHCGRSLPADGPPMCPECGAPY